VVYGLNNAREEKPLKIQNLQHSQKVPYTGHFHERLDFKKFEQQLKKNQSEGLVPFFVVLRPRDFNSIDMELEEYRKIAERFNLTTLLDMSEFDLNPLHSKYTTLQTQDWSFIDYITFNFDKLSGMTSQFIMIKNRESLKNSLLIVEKDYYKVINKEADVAEKDDLVTEERYDAHHYAIGFGHRVAYFRALFAILAEGEKGLDQLIEDSIDRAV
jgi:hypothetical protein